MEAHEAPPPAAAEQQQEARNLPPSRLIISEMVLENFKSYAGEQRVGPFHKVRLFFQNALAAVVEEEKKWFRNLAR